MPLPTMHQVYLSLGTNLGRRRSNLQKAIWDMAEMMVIQALSPVYETKPWGGVAQPTYLNMCLTAQTSLEPRPLLNALKKLENKLGRQPTIRWGARQIDIDILFFDDLVCEEADLIIPHPHLLERAFVLIPLNDIAPHYVHPVVNESVATLCQRVDASGVSLIREPLFATHSSSS
ncbi:MAG TPA: 2-amino-4-hydroxy-6-hydroxymethyldihydropteridine diphosphokinase [Anaerolineae bacterium]|nr:2-amino-4-hydroxy-6-hydroxymethyldihydropteridine diphosphokinase [Anaerolineae bacterium]